MGYAVRNDGVYGWRSVSAPEECAENETYQEVEPTAETNPDAEAARIVSNIEGKYAAKRAALRDDMLHVLTMDGLSMESLMASIRVKWTELMDAEAAEIDANFN